MSEAINVQVIMQEIRERVRQQTVCQEPNPLRAFPAPVALPDLGHLERVGRDLRSRLAVVGQMPAQPPTLRGRIGAVLVRAIRRALFWQTLQLQDFHGHIVDAYDQQLAVMHDLVQQNRASRQLTQELWTQVGALSAEVAGANRALHDQQTTTKRLIHTMIGVETQARRNVEGRLDLEGQLRERLTERLTAELAAEKGAREELRRFVDSENAAREGMLHALTAEAHAREALARRIEAEVAIREIMQEALGAEVGARENLAGRMDSEIAAREGLHQALGTEAGAREDLARRMELEIAAREELQQALGAETGAREDLARRVDSEIAAWEGLHQALGAEASAREELARRVDSEIAAREGLHEAWHAEAGAREELARRVDSEIAAREGLHQVFGVEASAREALQHSLGIETAATEHLGRRIDAEIVARESLQQALTEEMGAREALAGQYRATDIAVVRLRADLSSQSARITTLLREARKRLPAEFEKSQLAKLSENKHSLDSLYLALEDRFRGGRAEIKERLRFYLPLLQNQKIGVQKMPVLDLGCGRGEWLELLCETGLEARGVDTNSIFIGACKERGLNVVDQDAVEHLSTLPDASVGAVTGFHIIEHLPLDTLIQLVDETIRVLKPGGLAIFETPNPQNVLVGCHNFYIDPTHRHPVPCLLAQFILEARGLCDVEIMQLHPYPDSFHVRDGGGDLAQRFNEYFYGSQDYAVIGRRV